MNFIHTGLAASSEEKADLFYNIILGLEKSEPKILDRKQTKDIFGIDSEFLIIHYKNSNVDFEILIYKDYIAPEKPIIHSCIQVTSLASIIKKCREAGMKVIEVQKGSKVITFISDFDGNLFELKE